MQLLKYVLINSSKHIDVHGNMEEVFPQLRLVCACLCCSVPRFVHLILMLKVMLLIMGVAELPALQILTLLDSQMAW
jgi:hypothetical protein